MQCVPIDGKITDPQEEVANMSSKVNVGIVGAAGRLAAVAHANGLMRNENAHIEAVCDLDREVLETRAASGTPPSVTPTSTTC